jgi:hypothetical protein
MNRHGRRRKRSVTLWSENAAAGTTHPAHNNDYSSDSKEPATVQLSLIQSLMTQSRESDFWILIGV